MKTLLTMLLFLSSLQVAGSPEDMYGMYDKDGKHRKMTEQVERMRQRSEEAENDEHDRKMRILVVSLLIGLVPVVVVGRMVVSRQTWKENPKKTFQAMAPTLAGGAALFAFNYGWFYLKYQHEEIFKLLFSLAVILLLIGIGIYVVRHKK